MKLEILLFAGLREREGASRVSVEMPAESSFEDLREQLGQEYPRLAPLLAFCRFAQGNEMVDDSERIDPTYTIALIPPVSGG